MLFLCDSNSVIFNTPVLVSSGNIKSAGHLERVAARRKCTYQLATPRS